MLIGMAPMRLPEQRDKAAFLPAGLSNPRSRDQIGGKIRYFLCWKPVVEHLKTTGVCFAILQNIQVLTVLRWIQTVEDELSV